MSCAFIDLKIFLVQHSQPNIEDSGGKFSRQSLCCKMHIVQALHFQDVQLQLLIYDFWTGACCSRSSI